MQFLRGYTESPDPIRRSLADWADDACASLKRHAHAAWPQIETDPLVVRASTSVPSAVAFDALRRQPALRAPAKIVWNAAAGLALVAEVPRREHLGDTQDEALAALDEGIAWLGCEDPSNGTTTPSPSLIEVLKGAGCFPRAADSGPCFADIHLGGSVCRALVAEGPDARVHLSLPATTVRVEGERCAEAAAVFAFEANDRLRLARVSVAPLASDRMRVVWDVVVNGGSYLDRCLPDALEALVVAREETARPLRLLRNHGVADAYLTSRRWRYGARGEAEQK